MKPVILALGICSLFLATPWAQANEATGLQETLTTLYSGDLPNVPGKSLIALEVAYPPGAATPPHTHPQSAFIYAYVLSGEIVSAVDDGEPLIYRPGDSWHEAPGAHHRVSRNASETEPARLLVIFVLDPGEQQMVIPDSN
jgi:quercetin dioxygenase-like cupin family protein